MVVVVNVPPDELLLRLKQGKVYLPQRAERAAAGWHGGCKRQV